ncbi:hypothetical protein LMG29542_07181 [Paraburkholderia humisilvae]|uniref:Uncharacterized protein n=1 Tax=Paraburkholderia humisilvae TaxID=627669 RepID=A0A6J5F6T7_9BURK|nr:hypothetical protein LMG29542_07181 [Paraburkholderia humisilvae]
MANRRFAIGCLGRRGYYQFTLAAIRRGQSGTDRASMWRRLAHAPGLRSGGLCLSRRSRRCPFFRRRYANTRQGAYDHQEHGAVILMSRQRVDSPQVLALHTRCSRACSADALPYKRMTGVGLLAAPALRLDDRALIHRFAPGFRASVDGLFHEILAGASRFDNRIVTGQRRAARVAVSQDCMRYKCKGARSAEHRAQDEATDIGMIRYKSFFLRMRTGSNRIQRCQSFQFTQRAKTGIF